MPDRLDLNRPSVTRPVADLRDLSSDVFVAHAVGVAPSTVVGWRTGLFTPRPYALARLRRLYVDVFGPQAWVVATGGEAVATTHNRAVA